MKPPSNLLENHSIVTRTFCVVHSALAVDVNAVKSTVLVWTRTKETRYGGRKQGDSCLPGTQSQNFQCKSGTVLVTPGTKSVFEVTHRR